MKKAVLVLFSVFIGTTVSLAQQHRGYTPMPVYIPVNQTPAVNYQYHDGTAFLRDGTRLTGRFQYNGRSVFTYRASSQAPRKRIGLSMIRQLTLAGADTLVNSRTDSTLFVRLGNRLYRQLTGGLTMVLDRRLVVDEERGKLGGKIYVLDEAGDLHTFHSLQKLNKWFYAFREQSGKKLPDSYLNESEIVKAVARINEE